MLCSHNVELFSLESHDGGHKLDVCVTEMAKAAAMLLIFKLKCRYTTDDLQSGH